MKYEPNWFERHLNWSAILGCVIIFFIVFLGTAFLYGVGQGIFGEDTEEDAPDWVFSLCASLAIFVAPLLPLGWMLKRKARSLVWLLLGLIPILGWCFLILLSNNSEQQPSINEYRHQGMESIPVAGDKTANFCFNCGNSIDPTWNACPQCGTKVVKT